MIQSVLVCAAVSVIVSWLTSRIFAKLYLEMIDKYMRDIYQNTLNAIVEILGERK